MAKALQRNRHPVGFICKHSNQLSQVQPSTQQQWKVFILDPSLPSGMLEGTEPVAIQVTFHYFRTLRRELVHPKDLVPINCRKGVVYSIPCADCPRAYIGQTGRSMDYSLWEYHCVQKNRDMAVVAIAEYILSCTHSVDLSMVSVVDAHLHTQTRCILEP